ncbi:hypothetical protein GJU43_13940 [Flavobacterium sp. LC2016-23]|uniref:hypothetical protein n=1 Tax=Flavobacterium sp. LC2016-23 TaxID=2666330 RepID=UPI0012B055AB|nr:hypothetical protein [Flavobacterium sp. LC2016-23]MRX40384.1 hypothetical protein [Flavobacterium sp. LC2016-23]
MKGTIFKVEKGKHISFELYSHSKDRFSTCLYSDTLGYVDQYKEPTTIHAVLVNEIKTIKRKIKENPKEKALKWLLSEVKKKRVEYSQLTLF